MGSVFRLEGGLMGAAYKNIGYLYHQSAMAVLLPAGCDNRGIHDGSLLYSYKSGQASVRQSYTKLFSFIP